MNKSKIGIIILLLLLAVGFATVTANLIINNNANISSNPDDFNVFFSNAITEDDSSAVISADKKTITYSTRQLLVPGDKSELIYTVTNESSQYDAEIDMSISFDSAYASYFKITYETFDDTNKTIVDAKSDKDGKITIELLKPVIEDIPIVITITYNANALERSSIAHGIYTVRFNNTGATSGDISTQDIVPGTNTSLLSNQLLRTGYTLAGWSTIENDTKVELYDEEEVLNLTNRGNTIDLYPVWVKTIDNYSYTGNYQEFTAPIDGIYNIQLWGAQGGQGIGGDGGYHVYDGPVGAYTSGNIKLNKDETIYIYVGQKGKRYNTSSNGGWNGGGNSKVGNSGYDGGGGGGATDVRLVSGAWNNADSLRSRLMVAAGGCGLRAGCSGGGLHGYNYSSSLGGSGQNVGATQTSGYAFGIGGPGTGNYQAGSGGGWWGGYQQTTSDYSGSGASSYISGHAGCVAIISSSSNSPKTGCTNGTTDVECSKHYSGKVFTNTVLIDGLGYNWTTERGTTVPVPYPDGTTGTSGLTGNGYARITFISAIKES